jgi:hypothetical protein
MEPIYSHACYSMDLDDSQEINVLSIPQEIWMNILPYLFVHHNRFVSPHVPINRDVQVINCISKSFSASIQKAKQFWWQAWKKEHVELQRQRWDLQFNLSDVDKAIERIIADRYTVADLSGYPSLSHAHIEQLFKGNPHIKHLMVKSNNISILPDCCSQLETLVFQGTTLTHLPLKMHNLTKLHLIGCFTLPALAQEMPCLQELLCIGCYVLKSLPPAMVDLSILDCRSCFNLLFLPIGMHNLKSMWLRDCMALQALPNDMYNIENLSCSNCTGIKKLPHMTKLRELQLYDAQKLTTIPPLPSLLTLNCSHCIDLISISEGMLKLQKLYCFRCPKLVTLPPDLLPQCESILHDCPSLKRGTITQELSFQ